MRYAALAMVVAVWAANSVLGDTVPRVRQERPRIVLRAKAWDGPSVERIKGWMSRTEYKKNTSRLSQDGVAGAFRYLVLNDAEAGKKAVAWLKKLKPPSGTKDSPSYTGERLMNHAMIYDWLRDHPDFSDAADRQGAIAYFEWWGDRFKRHNSPGVVPFYSRNSGACLGLTAIAIALHGDSPKADEFLAHAFKDFRENIGTIRQAEDGATGGGTYGYVHQFGATAQTAASWRSGTDWDAARWIRDNQGNWLERQLLWQIWSTYPNGWLWKEGDIWSGSHRDRNEYALSVAAVSDMYRNGQGRAHHEAMIQRWGLAGAYYKWRILWFYLYNNPDIPVQPLDALGRAEVFSPDLHAYVCWRDSWRDDATIVHFKAGENVDHHGTWDTGKFTIWKKGPLAIKSGAYEGGYKGHFHHYYKLPYSANCVIFFNEKTAGWQPAMPDLDGYASWPAWKARRDERVKHPVTGKLLRHEANEKGAFAVSDLSGSTYPSGSTWIRELAFLDYKYLVVLDRVKPGKGTTTKWLLQSIKPAKIDAANHLITIDNGQAVLRCKTLLPEKVRFKETGVIQMKRKGKFRDEAYSYPFRGKNGIGTRSFPKHWFQNKKEQMVGHGRVEVIPENPAAETVYLHVLVATDAATTAMPDCSVVKKGNDYGIKVGGKTHTFKAP